MRKMQVNKHFQGKYPFYEMRPFIKYPAYLQPYMFPKGNVCPSDSTSASSSSSSSLESSISSSYLPQSTTSLPSFLRSKKSTCRSLRSWGSRAGSSTQRSQRRVGFQMDAGAAAASLHYQTPFMYPSASSHWLCPTFSYFSEHCRPPRPILKRRVNEPAICCSDAVVYRPPPQQHQTPAPAPAAPCCETTSAVGAERSASTLRDLSSKGSELLPNDARTICEGATATQLTRPAPSERKRLAAAAAPKTTPVKRKRKRITMKMVKHERMLLTKIEKLLEKLASSPKTKAPEKQEQPVITMSTPDFNNQQDSYPASVCQVRTPFYPPVPQISNQQVTLPVFSSQVTQQQTPFCVSVPQVTTNQMSYLAQSVSQQSSCLPVSGPDVTNQRPSAVSSDAPEKGDLLPSPNADSHPEPSNSKTSLPPPPRPHSPSRASSPDSSAPCAPPPPSTKAEDRRIHTFCSAIHKLQTRRSGRTERLKLSIQEKVMQDLGKAARKELRKRAILKIVDLLFQLKVPGLKEIVDGGVPSREELLPDKDGTENGLDKETESGSDRELEDKIRRGVEKFEGKQKRVQMLSSVLKKPWVRKPRPREESETEIFDTENVDTEVSKFPQCSEASRRYNVAIKTCPFPVERQINSMFYRSVCPFPPSYILYPRLHTHKGAKSVRYTDLSAATKPMSSSRNHRPSTTVKTKSSSAKRYETARRRHPSRTSRTHKRLARDTDSSGEERERALRRDTVSRQLFSSNSLDNYGLRQEKERSRENKKYNKRKLPGGGSGERGRCSHLAAGAGGGRRGVCPRTCRQLPSPSFCRRQSLHKRSRTNVATANAQDKAEQQKQKKEIVDRFYPDMWTSSILTTNKFMS